MSQSPRSTSRRRRRYAAPDPSKKHRNDLASRERQVLRLALLLAVIALLIGAGSFLSYRALHRNNSNHPSPGAENPASVAADEAADEQEIADRKLTATVSNRIRERRRTLELLEWSRETADRSGPSSAIARLEEDLPATRPLPLLVRIMELHLDSGSNPDRVIDLALEVLESDPARTEAQRALAIALEQSGRNIEAIEWTEEILPALPFDHGILAAAANANLAEGRLVRARELFTELSDADPADVAARNKLAGVHAATGDLDRAIQLYERSIQRAPDNLEAYIEIAAALVRLNRPDEAVAFLSTAASRISPLYLVAPLERPVFNTIRDSTDFRALESRIRRSAGAPPRDSGTSP